MRLLVATEAFAAWCLLAALLALFLVACASRFHDDSAPLLSLLDGSPMVDAVLVEDRQVAELDDWYALPAREPTR